MHAHPFGKIKVNNALADRQVEREMSGVFFNFFSFFTLGTRLHISKFCVDLFRKF